MKALEILKEISIKCETDENFMGYTYDAKKVDKLIQEAIKELEEAMKPKTCEGCKHKPNDGECYYEPCGTCARFFYDHYELKVTP